MNLYACGILYCDLTALDLLTRGILVAGHRTIVIIAIISGGGEAGVVSKTRSVELFKQ